MRYYRSAYAVLTLVFVLRPTVPGAETDSTREASFADRPPEIEAGFAYEAISKGHRDWSSMFLEASNVFLGRTMVYGWVRETERFSLRDQELLAGAYHQLSDYWIGMVEAQGSTTHHVLPKWSLLVEAQHAFRQTWGVSAGLRHTAYNTVTVTRGHAAVEHYWGSFRAAYTFSPSLLKGGETIITQRIQLNYYYGTRNTLGMIYSHGREIENTGVSGVLAFNTHSIVLIGRYWFSHHWAVSHELGASVNEGLYTRQGGRLGLRYAF